MPGEDLLRDLYPQILNVSYHDVQEFALNEQDEYLEWLTICHDLHRQRNRSTGTRRLDSEFEGWPYQENPFMQMNFDQPMPPSFTDVMQIQYEMTVKGNRWLGIGVWGLAEEYYKIAIRLCIVSNDTVAALQNGANLALCYLAGGDCENALRLCEHLINASSDHFDNATAADVFGQASTIIRWSYIKTGKDYFAAQHTAWVLEIAPQHVSLDSSVHRIVDGVWNAIGDRDAAETWAREWADLQRIARSFDTRDPSRTFEEQWGVPPQKPLKLILPRQSVPRAENYMQQMEQRSEQFELLDRRVYAAIGQHVYRYGAAVADNFVNRLKAQYKITRQDADEIRSVVLQGFVNGIRLFVSVVALHDLDVRFQPDSNFEHLIQALDSDEERCVDLYNRYEVVHAIESLGDYTFAFQYYRQDMDKLPFGYPNSVRLEILSSISRAYLLCMLANE